MMLLELFSFLQSRVEGLKNDKGATAVEYGLLVALIAAVIIGAVAVLGGQVHDAFCVIVTKLGGSCPAG